MSGCHQEPPFGSVNVFECGGIYLDWGRAAGVGTLTDEGEQPVLGEAQRVVFESRDVDVDLAKEFLVWWTRVSRGDIN